MFVKLFRSMLNSTIWLDDDHVLRVWLAILLLSDSDGVIEISIPGLAKEAHVSLEQCKDAIERLEAPDEYSQSEDHEGRRIVRIHERKPIWHVVNYIKYRKMRDTESRREYHREYMRDYRKKRGESVEDEAVNSCEPPLTEVNQGKPPLTTVNHGEPSVNKKVHNVKGSVNKNGHSEPPVNRGEPRLTQEEGEIEGEGEEEEYLTHNTCVPEDQEKPTEKEPANPIADDPEPMPEGVPLAPPSPLKLATSRAEKTWAETASQTGLPTISKMTKQRKAAIMARVKDYSLEDVIKVLEAPRTSAFLSGATGWTASFDWLLKPTNFAKTLEGNYVDREAVQQVVKPKISATQKAGATPSQAPQDVPWDIGDVEKYGTDGNIHPRWDEYMDWCYDNVGPVGTWPRFEEWRTAHE